MPTDSKQESRREIAANIVAEWADAHQVTEVGPGTKSRLINAIEAALNAERSRAFDQGFILAVAEIMRTHGEDVVATDVLRANRPTDWSHIDKYDLAALQPIFDHEKATAAIRNGDTNA